MRPTSIALPLSFAAMLIASGACAAPSASRTRTYYVAADEVAWNYAPAGMNKITGKPFGFIDNLFVGRGPDRLGTVYKKAVYREYTDSTFATLKPRPPEWEHLGILGPLLRAEVGDTIKVNFRNNGHLPFSMHPHGVFYTKASEGASYADGAKGNMGGVVQPGGTTTYIWPVPERAGPAMGEGTSALWMYHSHVAEDADLNSGLVGPIIVTARHEAKPDGSPKDVDREIITGFLEMDENASPYFDENIKTYALKPATVKKARPGDFADPFYASNLKETMNGFVYGNGPVPAMNVGERVRWYTLADANFQVHAPHWHGNTVVANHMRTDVLSLTTMGMIIADMVPDDPGTWLFHCHVGPHLLAGMQSLYTVNEAAAGGGR